MQALILIVMLAIAVEGIVEYLATPVPSWLKPCLAAALAVVLCIAWPADLFVVLGFPAAVPHIGAILTGLIIGRGSNYLNDFVSQLTLLAAPSSPLRVAAALASSPASTAPVTSVLAPALPLDPAGSTPTVQGAAPSSEVA